MTELGIRPIAKSPNHSMITVGVVGAGTTGRRHCPCVSQKRLEGDSLRSRAPVSRGRRQTNRQGPCPVTSKERLTAEASEQALSRLKVATRVEDLGVADFIVEAVHQSFDVKARAFRAIGPHCAPQIIFASNTSSISITRLAASTARPSRFVGLHFFNPVPVDETRRGGARHRHFPGDDGSGRTAGPLPPGRHRCA